MCVYQHYLRCFPVNFEKFLRTPLIKEQLRWLLLLIVESSYCFMKDTFKALLISLIYLKNIDKLSAFGYLAQPNRLILTDTQYKYS